MDLASKANRMGGFLTPWPGISDPWSAGAPNSSRWGRRSAAAQDGCCRLGLRVIASSSISGRPTIITRSQGGTRMLALDVYEHSYHIDFGAKAASYVDTFMSVIRWQTVDRLFGALAEDTGQKS